MGQGLDRQYEENFVHKICTLKSLCLKSFLFRQKLKKLMIKCTGLYRIQNGNLLFENLTWIAIF